MARFEDLIVTKLTVQDINLLDGGTITVGDTVFTRSGDYLLVTGEATDPGESTALFIGTGTSNRLILSDGSGTGT